MSGPPETLLAKTVTAPDDMRALLAEMSGLPDIIAARAKAEESSLAGFLETHLSEIAECERGSATVGALSDDLRRRLAEAARARIASEEASAIWLRETLAAAHANPKSKPGPLQIVFRNRNASVTLDLAELDAAVFRAALADVWPQVLKEWRDSYRVVHLPAPLVLGPGALAPMFGRSFRRKGQGRAAPPFRLHKQSNDKDSRRVSRIVLSSGERQLTLWSPGVVRLVNPSGDEIVTELARVLDNGAWRTFLVCLAIAQEDAEAGRAPPGAFLYEPTPFAELHGIRRQGGRIAKEHVRLMDARLETLGTAGFEATVKVAGKAHKVKADMLVYPAHVTMEDKPQGRSGGRQGRRPKVLYRINDALLELLRIDGAWWFPLQRGALAAPEGVQQPTWDDALKVFCLLAAKSRAEARAASTDVAKPWAWRLDALLTQANVAGENRDMRAVRRAGRGLLELLERSGLIRHEVDGEGDETKVSYDVPAQRQTLAAIPPPRRARLPERNS